MFFGSFLPDFLVSCLMECRGGVHGLGKERCLQVGISVSVCVAHSFLYVIGFLPLLARWLVT